MPQGAVIGLAKRLRAARDPKAGSLKSVMLARQVFSPSTWVRTAGRFQVVCRGLKERVDKSVRPSASLLLVNVPHRVTEAMRGKNRGFVTVTPKNLSTDFPRDGTFALTQNQIAASEKHIEKIRVQIVEVAASITAVQGQVLDVGSKIENTKIDLKRANLLPVDKEILFMELKSLMNKEEKLMDEKKSLMNKEEKLMDEKKSLMDAERALVAEMKILQEPLGATYVQLHNKWSRGQVMITGSSLSQSGSPMFALSQDFADVRLTGSSYIVDKSAFISEFLTNRRVVFRRPRRFGKSLFLSMLKYFFYGATDLFKGLTVYDKTIYDRERFVWCPSDPSKHNWPPFPVVHLDFSSLKGCQTADEFSARLVGLLVAVGEANKCNLDVNKRPSVVLKELLTGLSNQPMNERKKVVVLIDEYDTPLNERPSDDVSKGILKVYEEFFTELKALDDKICFAYVTGITSYAMAGIYSGANNFLDLTHSSTFESMCAFTEEEFLTAVHVTRPQDPPMSSDEMTAMKVQYNGYSWNLQQCKMGKRRTLFNPYFVAMYCKSGEVDDYWGQTTSASLLARFPAIVSIDVMSKSSSVIKRSMLKMPWFPSDNSPQDCVRNLFEAGYFTVVDVIDDAPASSANFATPPDADVHLGVPNQQIRNLFKSNYLSSLLPPNVRESPAFHAGKAAIKDGDMVALFKSLNDLYDSIPYQLTGGFQFENAWHVFAFTALSGMGLGENLVAEDTSQRGRSDIVLFVNNILFVMEIKAVSAKGSKAPLEREAREAIKQIGGGYLKSVFITSRLERATKVVLVGVVANIAKGKRGFAMVSTCEYNPHDSSLSAQVTEVKLHQLRLEDC